MNERPMEALERFGPFPVALKRQARWQRLVGGRVPVMIVLPEQVGEQASPLEHPPVVLWMHGRTVHKEIDPGRYLRWMRSGMAACAIDLPGHGERFEHRLQDPSRTLEVVIQMIDEIDGIVDELRSIGEFDMQRTAIGGMSAGGMAALARLCSSHTFVCSSVEATTGSWQHQREREMFRGRTIEEVNRLNPIAHLDGWREIPVQAIHALGDAWVSFAGQDEFLSALRDRYARPDMIEVVTYEETGAPHEHAGFGRFAADAKNRQREFLGRWLRSE